MKAKRPPQRIVHHGRDVNPFGDVRASCGRRVGPSASRRYTWEGVTCKDCLRYRLDEPKPKEKKR
jgi:hypothetical protein